MRGHRFVPRVRSALFVPAQRSEFLAGDRLREADAIILDLEDAVADGGKSQARTNAAAWLTERASSGVGPVGMVRVNALDHPGFDDDLEAIVRPGLTAVLVPKIIAAGDVEQVADRLSWHEGRIGLPRGTIRIWPIIETAQAVRDIDAIAASSDRIEFMGGGTSQQGDLARSIGFEWSVDGHETLYIRSRVLVAGRAAGIQNPMSGLVSGLAALDEVERFAVAARQLGYAGMMVIHPSHIAIVNRVFSPTAEQLDDAVSIIDALRTAGSDGIGAVEHDGRMIDIAMAKTAQQMLDHVERTTSADDVGRT